MSHVNLCNLQTGPRVAHPLHVKSPRKLKQQRQICGDRIRHPAQLKHQTGLIYRSSDPKGTQLYISYSYQKHIPHSPLWHKISGMFTSVFKKLWMETNL